MGKRFLSLVGRFDLETDVTLLNYLRAQFDLIDGPIVAGEVMDIAGMDGR